MVVLRILAAFVRMQARDRNRGGGRRTGRGTKDNWLLSLSRYRPRQVHGARNEGGKEIVAICIFSFLLSYVCGGGRSALILHEI